MSKKRIVLLSRDHLDLPMFQDVKSLILQTYPDLEVVIFSGDRNESTINAAKDNNEMVYLYRDYAKFYEENKNASAEKLANLGAAQSHIIDGAIYKSEKRYIEESVEETTLVLEQIYMVDFVNKWLSENDVQMLFMTDGATISRTATLAVCENKNLPYYRMFPAGWLNLKKGQRYFFANNNFRTLSNEERDKFDYEQELVDSHARMLLEKIKNDLFQLDTRAINMKKARFQTTWKDFARFARNLLFSFKKKYRIKLKQMVRPFLNRHLNRWMSIHQSELKQPYFLFPLNWPDDAQLTLRAPHYRDVLSIVEQIANVLPYGYTLAIKEHPAWPGYVDAYRMRACLKFHKNVVLLRGEARMQDLLQKSSGLITLNSTAAVEAMLANKPVMCLAHAFYRDTGLTFDVHDAENIPKVISQMLQYSRSSEDTYDLLFNIMSKFYHQTAPVPGEVSVAGNVHTILADAIKVKLEKFHVN